MDATRPVICGVDGFESGFEALRQAGRLVPPGVALVAVTVCDPTVAVHGGWAAPRIAEEVMRGARETRDRAAAELAAIPNAEARVVVGDSAAELLRLAHRLGATLLVVGTHGHRRAAGIALGNVGTTLLHEAPCPVLVARPPADPDAFPRSITVGTNGSAPAHEAVLTASSLAARFDAPLHVVVAARDSSLELPRLRTIPRIEWSDHEPVAALLDASSRADLLVVGSRALHGVRALGSVSEQVAHRAACSVLVVRPTVTEARPRDVAGEHEEQVEFAKEAR